MRSDSSTCAGSPEDMRPATYLTSGENASTSCSRARLSPSSLYRRHSSRSSTALTLVSTVALYPCLCARMRLCIGLLKPLRLYPSVGLSRADARVAQQLLNRAEVGAALEQMGRERVPERVRRHPGRGPDTPGGQPQAAAHVARREAPAALREEQGGLDALARRGTRQLRPAAVEIGLQRAPAHLAGGEDSRPRALAGNSHLLGVRIEVGRIEIHDLLGARARSVCPLEHGGAAQVERRAGRGRLAARPARPHHVRGGIRSGPAR